MYIFAENMYKFVVAIILSLTCTVMVWSIPPGISPGVAAADFVDAFMQREYFIDQHKQEIDSLRALPRTAINEYNLARVWARIQADSAVKHMRIANDLATEINDFSLHIKAGSAICSMLPHIDAEGEALHHFQILDTVGASPEARLHYHMAGQEIWFTLAHTTALDTIRHLYLRKGAEHSRAICAMTHPNDVRHNLAAAHNAYVQGHNAVMAANVNELLDNPEASHLYKAQANLLMARHYAKPGINDTEMANYYTLRAGTEYIRDGNLLTSIPALAALIVLDDPSNPIDPDALRRELGNALAGGSSIAATESAPYLHLLTDMDAATIRHLKVIGSIITAIAILLLVMLIYICVRLRKATYDNTALAKLNDKLRRDDIATRQTYINRFIRLCDSFMGSSEEFLKSARRKLSAGQVNDLKLLLKGSELADEQHRMFYATFDSAFLHTFPNFVQEVNSLLMEDKQIEPQPSNTLSTELRIAAFARLGVEDSTKVARFLGLSLTTVYTYRNKLRSKALNRATFFDDLKLPISVNPPTSNQP